MGIVRSYPPGLNKGRAAADAEAAAAAADTFDSIGSMLEGVQDFAARALKDELAGGHYQDQAAEILDAISDAIGAAKEAEGKIR
jgi:hypothetical protein